ncbi:diguanylate cyclase/phosphodiesterase (GGDEF & EAL domains) with PAS/PAC sensor(s) [hydrothermal vent metagenome]|uniref:Diguanylate cyclase/phosphodiesterase (GGDEF & EAL domains) with PAS/PAC sensor(S) n=1 Tax=hydrothermal vent metagenome TaxID=652676 RepID=A0A3B1B0Z7_9ZZZZ
MFKLKQSSPLSRRLLITILLSSSLVTLIITAIQLTLDYKNDIHLIENRLNQIRESVVQPIANSIWNFNKKQYDMQLKGILNLDDIIYVEIKNQEGKLIIKQGKNQTRQTISKTFSLVAQDFGKQNYVGKLTVVASLSNVYQHLMDKTLIILASQTIKTILISAVIIFAFYYLVTRHLQHISEYTRNFNIDEKNDCCLNRAAQSEPDELDYIVNSLNNLKGSLKEKRENIVILHKNLEQTVQKRTKALTEKQEQLEKLATHDPLTNLYNRRKFDDLFDHQWHYTKRNKTNFSLAIIDIDYFKNYNDNYGHKKGDEVLKQVAKALVNSVKRPQDSISRFGGEEFVLLLPEINMQGFYHVLQNVKDNINKLNITHEKSAVSTKLTVTIGGVLGIPSQKNSQQYFFAAADKNLYRGKERGRNQIVVTKLTPG